MARFGMVGKLVAQPGQGQELLELLIAATRELQARTAASCTWSAKTATTSTRSGCWRRGTTRRRLASLDLPAVRGVIDRGLPLTTERDGAKLEPVGGLGLD
jgi:hypothetical protein